MFRTLVLAVAFFGVTLALILFQPAANLQITAFDDTVTRGASAAAPSFEQAAVSVPVTRAADAGLVEKGPVDADLRSMTQGVLAGLGVAPKPAEDAGAPADDALRAMSLQALSGLRMVTGQPAVVETPLQNLSLQALQAGQSDSYIDALLNEAAGRGEITVPGGLMTAQGRVDTHVILSSIVAEASRASGNRPEAPAAPSGPGVEVRSVQRAGETVQYNFYTVDQGDSLGAIAAKFYGDAARFDRIFEANRALLSSPDKLRVGQRLVIPAL